MVAKQKVIVGVFERCEKRLSLEGKLALTNSVLDSLPTYAVPLFPYTCEVEKTLDKLRRDLLWEGNKDKKVTNEPQSTPLP